MADPYTDTYWYPSGALATNVPARVFPRFSNTLAVLWQDAAETVPQSNPVFTSGTGVLQFYADPGDYWIHIGEESFPVTIDGDGINPEVWQQTFQFDQVVASDTWVINHNMNARPAVSIIIGSTLVVGPDVNYDDLNNITVTFGSPNSGTAYLRR